MEESRAAIDPDKVQASQGGSQPNPGLAPQGHPQPASGPAPAPQGHPQPVSGPAPAPQGHPQPGPGPSSQGGPQSPAADCPRPIPAEEPERQQFFMNQARRQLSELSGRLGRPLTCCINTFGCQMNPATRNA